MKIYLKFITLLLVANSLFAQNCNCFIRGKVTDASTKEPVVGAIIYIKELNKAAFADEKGYYKLESVCQGKYTLITQIIGYENREVQIDLKHGIEENILLHEEDIHFESVEIKARKIENLTQSQTTLEGQNLENTKGQNLGESLKQITGVTTLQTGSSISKPVIHGLHSNRILIVNNGVRQEGQQWGSEHAPEIDPFVAKRLTVVKGAAGVRYGSDAIGGVILVEADPLPDSAKLAGEVNQVYFSNGRQSVSSAILEGILSPKKGLRWRVQGTFKKGGDVSTPNYRLGNTGVQEINYSLTLGYKKERLNSELFFSQFNTQIGLFTGSHIGNLQDLLSAIQRTQPLEIYTPSNFSYNIDRPKQVVQHNLLKIKTFIQLPRNQKISFTLGRQYNFREEIDISRGDKNLVQNFQLTTYSTEVVYDLRPYRHLTSSIGMNGIFQQNITTGILKTPRTNTVLIPNYQQLNGGLFWIERWVKEKWEVEGGLRFDKRMLNVFYIKRGESTISKENLDNQNFTGTLGAKFTLFPQFNVALNFASAWRAASVNELFSDGVHHGTASYEKGDISLKPEVAKNSSLNLNYSYKHGNIEALLYYNAISNYIFQAPTGRAILTIRGAFPEFWYAQTNAVLKGFDINMNHTLFKNLKLTNKYAYLTGTDQIRKQALMLMPANRLENSLQFSFKKHHFSIQNQYIFKQTRIPSKLIFDTIPSSEIIFKDYAGDFAAPPAAFSLWNLQYHHEFMLNKHEIGVGASVQNVFNTVYRDYLNRLRYFSDEMGRNISVRLKYSF